jgi:hypothetical protein
MQKILHLQDFRNIERKPHPGDFAARHNNLVLDVVGPKQS